MKKLILLLIVSISSLHHLQAQIQKGTILLEGDVSFNNTRVKHDPENDLVGAKTTQESKYFSVTKKAGYFLNESFLVGLGLGYTYTSTSYDQSLNEDITAMSRTTTNLYSITPYIKKFIKLNDKLFFTITGNSSVAFGDRYYSNSAFRSSDLTTLNINITPSFTYFVSKHWALTTGLGQLFYSYTREKFASDNDNGQTSANRNFGASLQLNTFYIGIQYFLRTKSE